MSVQHRQLLVVVNVGFAPVSTPLLRTRMVKVELFPLPLGNGVPLESVKVIVAAAGPAPVSATLFEPIVATMLIVPQFAGVGIDSVTTTSAAVVTLPLEDAVRTC